MKTFWILIAATVGYFVYVNLRKPSYIEEHMNEQAQLNKLNSIVVDIMNSATPPIGTYGMQPLTGAVVTPITTTLDGIVPPTLQLFPQSAGNSNMAQDLLEF